MKLVRCTLALPHVEQRRGPISWWHPGRHPIGTDILHSMNYWRRVRRSCDHAGKQYAAHRAVACGPSSGFSQMSMVARAIRCDVTMREMVGRSTL